jgi:hypothetical protein
MNEETGTAGRVIKVGVTGHRKLGDDPARGWFVHAECVLLLDRLRGLARRQHAGLAAYSALAVGADQLFAEAALGLGIPLVGVIPFEGYAADFDGDDRRRFEELLARCAQVHRLPNRRKSGRAYLEAGKWIVNEVDYLVAVWNGLPAAGVGGTADVVKYAERKGRAVLRIDPAVCRAPQE